MFFEKALEEEIVGVELKIVTKGLHSELWTLLTKHGGCVELDERKETRYFWVLPTY